MELMDSDDLTIQGPNNLFLTRINLRGEGENAVNYLQLKSKKRNPPFTTFKLDRYLTSGGELYTFQSDIGTFFNLSLGMAWVENEIMVDAKKPDHTCFFTMKSDLKGRLSFQASNKLWVSAVQTNVQDGTGTVLQASAKEITPGCLFKLSNA